MKGLSALSLRVCVSVTLFFGHMFYIVFSNFNYWTPPLFSPFKYTELIFDSVWLLPLSRTHIVSVSVFFSFSFFPPLHTLLLIPFSLQLVAFPLVIGINFEIMRFLRRFLSKYWCIHACTVDVGVKCESIDCTFHLTFIWIFWVQCTPKKRRPYPKWYFMV